ncbi:MAG: adenylate cyclase [Gammaproteobacteria bacterium]|jgi:adenylate cyclase
MFTDIVGSTRLYEITGKQTAEALISKTLNRLSEIMIKSEGNIIKTVGDEAI